MAQSPINELTKIGNLELGAVPRLVAVIDDYIDSKELKSFEQFGVTILEIRVDSLKGTEADISEYLTSIRDETNYAIIGTIRETPENKSERTRLFESLMSKFDCIDIEFEAKIKDVVIEKARNNKVQVLISYHDFQGTPTKDALDKIVEEMLNYNPDFIKLATMATTYKDVGTLMTFTDTCPFRPLVTIAMGHIGAPSRVFAPTFGSLFTYGYVRQANAPGIVRVSRLHDQLREHFPAYNEDFVIKHQILEAV